MILYKKIFLLLLIIVSLPCCGKKRRNFFTYKDTNGSNKINKLTLPAVKGVYFYNNIITWIPIKEPINANLLGYNIYKFASGKFIMKNPINATPITGNTLTNTPNKHKHCYVIRGVFKVANQVLEGPSSKTICK